MCNSATVWLVADQSNPRLSETMHQIWIGSFTHSNYVKLWHCLIWSTIDQRLISDWSAIVTVCILMTLLQIVTTLSIYLLNVDAIQGLYLLGGGGGFGFGVSVSLQDQWQMWSMFISYLTTKQPISQYFTCINIVRIWKQVTGQIHLHVNVKEILTRL